MKKISIALFILLLVSCIADIDYRLYESQIDLPLMGAQAGVSLKFYVVKKVPLNVLTGLDIQEANFNFTATSTKNMTFNIMVQDTGPDEETALYATCEPEIACAGVYAVYGRTPDYITQSPSLIQGTVDGQKIFENVVPEEEAITRIENAFEKGTIWVIVNVSTNDPLYFTQNDSLHIKDLEGIFKIKKDMSSFAGLSGGVF